MGTLELKFINSHSLLSNKTQFDKTKWPKFPRNVLNQLKTSIWTYSNWSSFNTHFYSQNETQFPEAINFQEMNKIEQKPANKFTKKLQDGKFYTIVLSTNGNERVLDTLLLIQEILHMGFRRTHLLLLLNLYYNSPNRNQA